MGMPQFKVSITHGGATTDYVSRTFKSISVTRRENNYDVATLVANNYESGFYPDGVAVLDDIKIYLRDATSTSGWPQVFGGTIRQANPSQSQDGTLVTLNCKGYGTALEETHCNRDYGSESSNPSMDTLKEICSDLVDNMINKSLGLGSNTGYAITKTKIADIYSGTPIKYINNPYRTNLEVVDLVCELTSAIGAGTMAGAHWIVDNSKNLIINTIGAHENTTEWPDWWNTDEPNSTLEEGRDFSQYTILDKTEEFANNVILLTGFRRPAYDFWTEDGVTWGNDDLATCDASNAKFVVGSVSQEFTVQGGGAPPLGRGYFPSTENAAWDMTRWGSMKTVPHINYYMYKNGGVAEALTELRLFSTDHDNNYFGIIFSSYSEGDNEFYHKSIPVGPYWASAEESKQFRWTAYSSSGVPGGTASWGNINGICFCVGRATAPATLYIDDLHFSGAIIRSARKPASITAKNEYQKVIISRNAMDDSCVASDDTGFAGRIAYAELLKRLAEPKTITFTVPGHPDMNGAMAGQKLHVHAQPTGSGAWNIDVPMRFVSIQHGLSEAGYVHVVTATSDLKNTSPINIPDQYAMWQENMFLFSKEAKNIRSGSEVDLLIPILQKNY